MAVTPTDVVVPSDSASARRRFVLWTWIACGAAGVAAGIAMSVAIGSAFGLAVAPLVALPLGLAVLVVRWCVRRGSIDATRDLLVPAAFLMGFLTAREGLYGSWIGFDVTWFNSSRHDEWSVKANSILSTTTWTSGGPPPGAGASEPCESKIEYTVTSKRGDGQIADGLREALSDEHWLAPDVSVDVTFDAPDSWCFVPLYKHGVVKCAAEVKATWTSPNSNGNVAAEINGTIDLTIRGLATRRRFNEEIGRLIAHKIAETVNEAIGKAD